MSHAPDDENILSDKINSNDHISAPEAEEIINIFAGIVEHQINIMKLEEEIHQVKPFRNDYHRASVNLIFTGKWIIQFHADIFKNMASRFSNIISCAFYKAVIQRQLR